MQGKLVLAGFLNRRELRSAQQHSQKFIRHLKMPLGIDR
jgi:hypothetical protein